MLIKNTMKKFIQIVATLSMSLTASAQIGHESLADEFQPLPAGHVQLIGYFDDDIHNSLDNWVKGVMPYDAVIEFFRSGRTKFALGEMPGKAFRTNALMYRYTQDQELKELTKSKVYDLIATMKSNGSISCTPVDEQPGDRDGDLWERKYVLLGLSQYYLDIEKDPKVLEALESEMKSIMDQIGPAPKIGITELGWSSNNIESSSLLEPVMRLYMITGKKEYLDFATYIVENGGGKGKDMFEAVRSGAPMYEVGAPYPKAYEMTSMWEGLVDYCRVTGDPLAKEAVLKFFSSVKDNEITIIGNAGSDVIWPKLMGEGWSNTSIEQTNPSIKRMMETCVGVTWMKYCSQYLRLTGDPAAVDCIERYAYNGLLGAMRPDGKGFSYVNLLNGEKVTNHGWGTIIDGLPVTCCNLNGPTGLAYIPYVAFMQSAEGPVINLYNAARASALTASGGKVDLVLDTEFPRGNEVSISVTPEKAETFVLKLHIPSWSGNTLVFVNGRRVKEVQAGSYLSINRKWKPGDSIHVVFDMRARLLDAKEGRNPEGKFFQAVQWGPIVLARDENIDPDYNKPVRIIADDAHEVSVRMIPPQHPGIRMEFIVPTAAGDIHMVDYSSVDCWNGSHIQTWLPTSAAR